ncbi:hypothetical protein MRB53_016612 [Persea americana]|uniref:Uncharacterized protein n=1 Tax=Persea americana TaxID=3435 RepID=A0ACC2M3C4_PERAE|nr:hypothetical protein MRB53_016612 [Persea americana]
MNNYERIEAAGKKKEEGNRLFKGEKYRQAIRKYNNKVLDVESHNVKALYRQAQAYMETTDLDFAELDVKKALELDNRKQVSRSAISSMQQRDAKLYSNMFVRMRKGTTAEVKVMFSDNF